MIKRLTPCLFLSGCMRDCVGGLYQHFNNREILICQQYEWENICKCAMCVRETSFFSTIQLRSGGLKLLIVIKMCLQLEASNVNVEEVVFPSSLSLNQISQPLLQFFGNSPTDNPIAM